VAEGQAPGLLGPHLLDGVQDIRLLGHLHREVIVIRGPIPWLPTVNLQCQSPAHETTRSVKKRRGGKSTSVRVWQGRSKPSQRPTWSTTASAINREVVVFPPVTEKRPAAPSASCCLHAKSRVTARSKPSPSAWSSSGPTKGRATAK